MANYNTMDCLCFFDSDINQVIEASDVILYVEVIEATEVFRTTQSLKTNDVKAGITFFWCFETQKVY